MFRHFQGEGCNISFEENEFFVRGATAKAGNLDYIWPALLLLS
jgi:hypothetical protein